METVFEEKKTIKQFNTKVLLLVLLLSLSGCSTTKQNPKNKPEEVPATDKEPTHFEGAEVPWNGALVDFRESVENEELQLFAEQIQELEQVVGTMVVDIYPIDTTGEIWHSLCGVSFIKLIDLDIDGTEEMIVVWNDPDDYAGIPTELETVLLTWGAPASKRWFSVYEMDDGSCSELVRMELGGAGSPVMYQLGIGEYNHIPCIFRWIGSGRREIYTKIDGEIICVAVEERTQPLVYYSERAYRLPDPNPEEEWYYFSFSHDQYEYCIDPLLQEFNDIRSRMGLSPVSIR